MTNFILNGNRDYVFDIPKFWRYLIALFPLKALLNCAPYLNSVTRPKSVYSVDLITSPPAKKTVLFKPDLLEQH